MEDIISKRISNITGELNKLLEEYKSPELSEEKSFYDADIMKRKETLVTALISALEAATTVTIFDLEKILEDAISYNEIIAAGMLSTEQKLTLPLYVNYASKSNEEIKNIDSDDYPLEDELFKELGSSQEKVNWFLSSHVDSVATRHPTGSEDRLGDILKKELGEIKELLSESEEVEEPSPKI